MKKIFMPQTSDYDSLHDWCLTIYDYYSNIDSSPMGCFIVSSLKQALEKNEKNRDLKLLKELCKETVWLFQEDMLGITAMEKLNDILKDKFGISMDDVSRKDIEYVNRILSRGKIINTHEYELVKCREEEVYGDESSFEYAEKLRQLMLDFELCQGKSDLDR